VSAKTDVLHVELREKTGTLATTRLRRTGRVPAILYGHGQATQHLSIASTEIRTLLRHHGKAVTLDGAVNETALVSELQFDALGIEVLHLDLIRVNLQERITITVPVHLTGDAIGSRSGGVLLENMHEVEIRCSAGAIPEFLSLNVSDLEVGGHKIAGDLTLPEGVELLTPREVVVAHIEKPRGEVEVAPALGAQPDVVAKAADKEKKAD
jgi:large subunit ribosomal protein L25